MELVDRLCSGCKEILGSLDRMVSPETQPVHDHCPLSHADRERFAQAGQVVTGANAEPLPKKHYKVVILSQEDANTLSLRNFNRRAAEINERNRPGHSPNISTS